MKKEYLLILIIILFLSCKNKSDNIKTVELTGNFQIDSISLEIRKNPRNAKLFVERAELNFNEANLKEAINDMSIALKLDSTNQNYLIRRAEFYLIGGNSEQSKNDLEKCLTYDRKNGEALLKLAYIYYYVQMYQNALILLQDLETFKLHSSESYFLKGLVFEETEMDKEAIEALQKSIEYDNHNWKAYQRIALVCAGIKDKRAVDYFETAIKLFPENTEIRYNAGVIFQQFGHYEKAANEYKFVIQKEPDIKEAHENLGIIYTNNLIDYQRAIEEFSKTIELDSLDHTAYYNRGYVYEKLKNYAKATENYQKCLKIHPNFDLAIQGLNELYGKK